MSAFVDIRDLGKTYSGDFSLNSVSIGLEKGEIMTLMGPSGSGKTSLLRNISGLDIPDTGTIRVNGRDITRLPPSRRNIGMIFQDLAIFPHMKVYDNIAYGLRSTGRVERDVENRVHELAELLGIKKLLDRYPGKISGGQRQRVALARSVAPSPSLLLLDEPMSSLDTQLRSELRGEIKSFARELELTMIYVTHDHNEGLYMADQAGVMYEGNLEAIGQPRDVFGNPRSERTARFFGYNVVTVEGGRYAFYPTEFELESTRPDIEGRVLSLGFEGEHDRVLLKLEDGSTIQLELQPGRYEDRIGAGMKLGIKIKRKVGLNQ